MCGIAGIVSREKIDPIHLYKMSGRLKHRGPDDEGYALYALNGDLNFYKGDDTIQALSDLRHITETDQRNPAHLGLVHRRLAIIDLGASGHQPMNYLEKYTLVFNGEIYNYKELRASLQKENCTFKTESDTEVVLAAYHKYGLACVEKFVGMWAFALLDQEKNLLFLSRDRFGIKPLYYYKDKNTFAFASEIKALLALELVKPEAKLSSAFEYISYGATHNPNDALYQGIKTLEPAHSLFLPIGGTDVQLKKYYELRTSVLNYSLPTKEKTIDTFNNLLNNSIDIHLRSDVPVGSTLSGGLDSSTLVTRAAKRMEGKIFNTFTACYTEQNIDESNYAKLVTATLPNAREHLVYPSIENYWADLEKLTWHQDLPIGSTSMFAQWEVMKRAKKENTKVLLDGQGADEILGGYYNFAGIHLIELLKGFHLSSFFSEKKQLQTNFTPNMNTAIGRALFYFLPGLIQRKVRSKKRLGSGFISNDHADEINRMKVPRRGGKNFREQSLLSIEYGLQDLLRYEDRNSMAFSIESRVPFLDHRLVEFCIALKNEWKIREGWTKYILRKAETELNPAVTWRKDKMGFLTPQKSWKASSQKELSEFIDTCEIPDFINKKYLVNLCSKEIADSAHLSEFWRMISFLKWVQVFNVKFS